MCSSEEARRGRDGPQNDHTHGEGEGQLFFRTVISGAFLFISNKTNVSNMPWLASFSSAVNEPFTFFFFNIYFIYLFIWLQQAAP